MAMTVSSDRVKLLILLHHRFDLWQAPEWLVERLRRDFPQLEVVHLQNYDKIEKELADAEILVGWSLRPEQFAAARKLRWIHSTAAAVHQLMFPELVSSKVVLTNAREVHGPVVAEHAIALVLACAKRLRAAIEYQQRKTWAQDAIWNEPPGPREIAGVVLGLIGLGAIGRRTAQLAKGLSMHVLAVREHPERGAETADEVFGPHALAQVLARSDYVVVAAPVTSETQHFMNAERLRQMKKDAYLINVSRGVLVDEAALIEVLWEGLIAGAALDVFEHEPLPSDSPLWTLKGVLITPHTAGLTSRMWERHYAHFSENLRRYLAGEPLRDVVNKEKGY